MTEKATEKVFDLPEEWKEVDVVQGYYPTRLEYFAGKALQGLVTGRSEKAWKTAPIQAVEIAQAIERELDSAQG